MILKRILIVILIISISGLVALVVTDPNIIKKGNDDFHNDDSAFFDVNTGFDYNYFSAFPTSDDDNGLEKILLSSWQSLDEEINISSLKIKRNEFESLYYRAIYDNPIFYYVNSDIEYAVTTDGYVEKIYPRYIETDQASIESKQEKINNATANILNQITDSMGDFEKVMTVHDYMVLNYKYDQSLENHSLTIMYTKTGVCDSYSKAFKHLMNELGIECQMVVSDKMDHSWNVVCIDGKWYHIDLTMDDPTPDKYAQVSHSYALLSTDAIENADEPHYDFDLGEINADSDIYDNAPWRESTASIVCIDGETYWIDENNLVSSDSRVLYSDLDGDDGMWNITSNSGYGNECFAGLGVCDGVVYFNTDESIMSYDPDTDDFKEVKSIIGVCGIYIQEGALKYSTSPGEGQILFGGEFRV